MRLLFVHGWAFAPSLWELVAARLSDSGPGAGFWLDFADLGFFGPRRVPDAARSGGPPLVVAHSMGLAWALAHIPRPWAGAVAVNAFARFTRAEDYSHGVPTRVLRRMLDRFVEEPGTVVRDFRTRCGATGPVPLHSSGRADADSLGEALAWLAACDEREALAGLGCPLLALAGAMDPIVPEAMSRHAFAGYPLHLVEDGGHLLPLSHPGRVADLVHNLAERVA